MHNNEIIQLSRFDYRENHELYIIKYHWQQNIQIEKERF